MSHSVGLGPVVTSEFPSQFQLGNGLENFPSFEIQKRDGGIFTFSALYHVHHSELRAYLVGIECAFSNISNTNQQRSPLLCWFVFKVHTDKRSFNYSSNLESFSATGTDNVIRNVSGVGLLTNGLCQPLGLGVELPTEGGFALLRDVVLPSFCLKGRFGFFVYNEVQTQSPLRRAVALFAFVLFRLLRLIHFLFFTLSPPFMQLAD